MDSLSVDLFSVLLGLGVSLASVWVTQLLTLIRESYSRKASVRDEAYSKIVDACAEFIGVSHLHLSTAHDVVASLHRVKQADPTHEYPGAKLNSEVIMNVFQPMTGRYLAAGARAEALVTDDEARRMIEQMQRCNNQAAVLIRQGNTGSLPADWEQRLDRLVNEHDQASLTLVDHVRRLGAKTTYRNR